MKKLVLLLFFSLSLPLNANAIYLSLEPSVSIVGIGDTFFIDVKVFELENDNLASFDLDVNYDNSLLEFNSYTLTQELGSFSGSIPDAEDWSLGDDGFGTVNLSVLSYLWDLSFQSDEFLLGTLSFTGTNGGIGNFGYSNVILSDDWGDSLIPSSLDTATVSVASPVPVPSTFLLTGLALLSFAGVRKKFKNYLN